MKSVRIEPTGEGSFAVDVVCDCGRNALRNVVTGEVRCDHPVVTGQFVPTVLECACGKAYNICPQRTHFHVNDFPR